LYGFFEAYRLLGDLYVTEGFARAKGEADMKKAVVRSSSKGTSPSIQAAPAGTVNTVATEKLDTRSQSPSTPIPGWNRYVDSRLKQFCLR
jgi:hypothetical protein